MESKNAYGRTPLLLVARESGSVELARLRLDRKADVNATDKFSDTPLTLAAWRGFRAVVDLLVERGAAVPAQGNRSQQLLHSAAEKGLDTLFARMADAGAVRDGTLLREAAIGGSVAIIELFFIRSGRVYWVDAAVITDLRAVKRP